jgi:hypothetical protein
MNLRPGFTFRKIRPELLSGELRDWRTCIPISAAQLYESGEMISLGDKYFLSVGAHVRNNIFLMGRDPKEPLTVEKSLAASSLLTFATNSPVVPDYTIEKNKYAPSDFSKFERELTRTGIQSRDYLSALINVAEMVDILTDIGNTDFAKEREILSRRSGRCPFLSWPSSARTWRALTAYWSAILSVIIPGRILNFWRAIEAVTTKTERYQIFETLEHSRIKPVWTRSLLIRPLGVPDYRRVRNSSALLKRRALRRRRELIGLHGSTKDALDWLYMERRGKAAHADRSSLDFDGLSTFSDQISDAILFQYMARVAIEHTWS